MISTSGLDLIKQFEGFSSKAYYDVKGWTIGYGHFMGPNKIMDNIDETTAAHLLASDMQWVEADISKYVKVPLTQNQHDALTSFIYNVGGSNFESSTLLRKLNANDYAGAAAEFPRWNKAGGKVNQALVDRRASEQQLFLS